MFKQPRRVRRRERPPTIMECALAAVTASLAVAAVLLAVLGSARASAPETGALPADEAYARGPAVAVSSVQAAPGGANTPQPTPAAIPTPTPTAQPASALPLAFMALPVEGTWKVLCGYRCGLHDDAHTSTFALDIVRVDGQTAGQPVRSPVDGRVIAVVDSSSYLCDGTAVTGPGAGGVAIIEFPGPTGVPWRLRLAHLDSATIPEALRPSAQPLPVSARAFLGSVAPLDRCSHLHISLTSVEGDREVPQPLTVAGQLLADCGSEDCWRGATLPPATP